ncbi:MAG: ATP-binding protein [Parasulfuritortus sp.]|nr:ATP-binding protein [Parasulfuritortus sp.]
MGRLFWKIFLTIFLAQVATTAAVSTLFWFMVPNHGFPPPNPPGMTAPDTQSGRPPPPPARMPPHEIPLLPIGIGLLASLAFAFLLARHLSKPILGLRAAFKEVARGNFDVRLTADMGKRRDELADLGRDFDSTAKQLKLLLDSQRRLLHHVSHEVRSPLARMQLAIDLARQQPEKTQAAIERIERESGRIDGLMEELLTLSRLEARAYGNLEDEVDIEELVSEIIEDARFEAEAKGCRVELAARLDEMTIKGRADLLHRAIENVIRNAVRHTFNSTRIDVVVARSEDMLVIHIDDEGSGMPESALGAMFEPFVRFHENRGNDGYGLGLAITREVIEAHRGTIRATNRESGGLRMEIHLPMASRAGVD